MEELRVYAIRNTGSEYYKVERVDQAKSLIESLANNDLKCDFITWNSFGLEVRNEETIVFAKEEGFFEETDGWEDWRNEDGYGLQELERLED